MNTAINPLLLIGHGTRDADGRQTFLDFATAFQEQDLSRPVIPCFLELTEPSIQQGIDHCVAQGYREMTALPVLLFAARHNKFDVTNELDKARLRYPELTFHYGRHFGITPSLLELWQERLAQLDETSDIPRAETILLFVGRGASDPDANSDVYKMARLLWEGSGFKGVEICFIGITHPRMEQGFERAWTWQAKRVLVLPYFLFTGVLVKRIHEMAQIQQKLHPEVQIQAMNEVGLDPVLFELIREREQEARSGQVMMNCEMCKFRRAVSQQLVGLGQDNEHHQELESVHAHHGHGHEHAAHSHSHTPAQGHSHEAADPYAEPIDYHQRVWQIP